MPRHSLSQETCFGVRFTVLFESQLVVNSFNRLPTVSSPVSRVSRGIHTKREWVQVSLTREFALALITFLSPFTCIESVYVPYGTSDAY
jgi:hypothetical protein